MKNIKTSLKKHAFTLAEVLITIGILGIISALTIPNIIGNYRKKVVVMRLEKLYSILNQAIIYSEAKNGACSTWNWGSVNEARNPEFQENWWNTYFADYIPNVTSIKTNKNVTGSYMVFFKDGTALRIEAITSKLLWVVLYVKPDLDLQKFASGAYRDRSDFTPGKDYFGLYVFPEIKCTFNVDYYDKLSSNELVEACKNQYTYGGPCLNLIINNTWKIPNNYPIKF